MGFASRGGRGMGYSGPMGYSMEIPALRVSGLVALWDIRRLWVIRDMVLYLRL